MRTAVEGGGQRLARKPWSLSLDRAADMVRYAAE